MHFACNRCINYYNSCLFGGHSRQGRLHWGARGAAAPSALLRGGQEGQVFALCAALFPSLISREGAFSGVVDSLVATNFSGG